MQIQIKRDLGETAIALLIIIPPLVKIDYAYLSIGLLLSFYLKRIINTQLLRRHLKSIVHDLQSPLAALNLIIRPHDVTTHKVLQRINHLTNELSAMESEESLKIVSIKLLIKEILREKKLIFSNDNTRITTRFSGDPLIRVSPEKLKRVISNIINNAHEALAGKGKIEIQISQNHTDVQLVIRDNGIGIPEKILKKIGGYGNSYNKEKGKGIGLYHAIKALEKWNGNLAVYSMDKKGTTINLKIPRAYLTPDAILIDDDPLVHIIWETQAKKNGMHLKAFYSPNYLLRNHQHYLPTTSIYLDLILGRNLRGEKVSYQLFKQGFHNIYLVTGDHSLSLKKYPWIKNIRGKIPPW